MSYHPEGWPWERHLDFKVRMKYMIGYWDDPSSEAKPEIGIHVPQLHRHWLICAICGNEIEPCRDLNCDHHSDHIERRWKQMPNMIVAELLRNCELCAHDRLIASLARKLGRV